MACERDSETHTHTEGETEFSEIEALLMRIDIKMTAVVEMKFHVMLL